MLTAVFPNSAPDSLTPKYLNFVLLEQVAAAPPETVVVGVLTVVVPPPDPVLGWPNNIACLRASCARSKQTGDAYTASNLK